MPTQPYERLEGTATAVLPLRRNVGYLRVSGGSSFDTALPLYDSFTLGGPVSLPGLSLGELRGYVLLERAGDLSAADCGHQLRFRPVDLRGPDVTAADMSGRIDGVRAADLLGRLRAGRSHAARSGVAVARGDEDERMAARARARAAHRGTHDQRPQLVIARPRLPDDRLCR